METFETNRKLRPTDAAKYLGLSPATLAKWRVIGCGPVFAAAGSAIIYDVSDLDAWVDARKRRSTSDMGGAR